VRGFFYDSGELKLNRVIN